LHSKTTEADMNEVALALQQLYSENHIHGDNALTQKELKASLKEKN